MVNILGNAGIGEPVKLDSLSDVNGFSSTSSGIPYALMRSAPGLLYTPVQTGTGGSTNITIAPNGGLEYTSANELKVKAGTGITATSNGLSVINHVKTTEDSMTGILSMGGKKITNVADPISNKDTANKEYVDTKTNSNIVTLDPNGGLKYNSSNELKVKINSGIRATSTGLSIVNHVQITGDTMIGNCLWEDGIELLIP